MFLSWFWRVWDQPVAGTVSQSPSCLYRWRRDVRASMSTRWPPDIARSFRFVAPALPASRARGAAHQGDRPVGAPLPERRPPIGSTADTTSAWQRFNPRGGSASPKVAAKAPLSPGYPEHARARARPRPRLVSSPDYRVPICPLL